MAAKKRKSSARKGPCRVVKFKGGRVVKFCSSKRRKSRARR
jgi:hypothetical protein